MLEPNRMQILSALDGRQTMGGVHGGDLHQRLTAFQGANSDWRPQLEDLRSQHMNALGGGGARNRTPPGMPVTQANPLPGISPNGLGIPPNLPPQANVPQHNPVFGQVPLNMVGQSYGVQGLNPALSGFDLPTY